MTATARARKPVGPDAACLEAVDLAREVALAGAPGEVGEHLGFQVEDERVVTHRFASVNPGYRGWHWAVTVVRAARAKDVTVAEVVLLPGDDAVLAPPWVPWVDRFRPEDLGPGDILPPPENDDRLLPGYTGQSDAPFDPADGGAYDAEADLVADELGLGRAQVLSPVGRADAIDRWYSGDRGPDAPIAAAAPAQCATCGFLLPLAGSMGRVFGVCANASAPDDGRVVSYDHGCGAHSEVVAAPAALAERPPPVLDHVDYDLLSRADLTGDAAEEGAEETDALDESDVLDLEPSVVEPAGFVPEDSAPAGAVPGDDASDSAVAGGGDGTVVATPAQSADEDPEDPED